MPDKVIGGKVDDISLGHGQHHLHASHLVYVQKEQVIPAIEELMDKYPGKIEVKFFHIKHHVNMVVYGSRRIFSAPCLVGTGGLDLPCLEVFPGLTSAVLFEKMLAEFRYIWDKPSLTFALSEMSDIYGFLSSKVPTYFAKHWIEAAEANEIEDYARAVVGKRSIASFPLTSSPLNLNRY